MTQSVESTEPRMSDPTSKRRRILMGLLPPAIRSDLACVEELLAYNQSPYTDISMTERSRPLQDSEVELHIPRWRYYLDECNETGIPIVRVLSRYLPCLRFPVRSGMSSDTEYVQATKQGDFSASDYYCAERDTVVYPSLDRLGLHNIGGITLEIADTPVGPLPVMQVLDRNDFVKLVQVFTRKNEPVTIPDSMGACIVRGFNNWDRIHQIKQNWDVDHPGERPTRWRTHFMTKIKPDKALYQDTFMICSMGAYSAVQGSDIGVEDSEWLKLSTMIRREHELTHYFTLKTFGAMHNHALDEIICDLAGVCQAFGAPREDVLLQCFGLEAYPPFRDGGRLANYVGDPPLSSRAFDGLCILVKAAVANLCKEIRTSGKHDLGSAGAAERAHTLHNLFRFSLEELADPACIHF